MDDRNFDDVMKQRLEAFTDTSMVDEAALVEVLDVADHLSPAVSSGGFWGMGGSWFTGILSTLVVIGGLWWMTGIEDQERATEMIPVVSEITASPSPEPVQKVLKAEVMLHNISFEPKNSSPALAPDKVHQRLAAIPSPKPKTMNLTVKQVQVRRSLPAIAQVSFERPQLPMMDVQAPDPSLHFHVVSEAEKGEYLVDFFGLPRRKHHDSNKSLLIRPCTASKSGCRR